MSAKSKNNSASGRTDAHAPDRPCSSAVWRQAAGIAQQYRVILEREEEVGYVGHALEMPMVMSDGKTPNACMKSVQEALTLAVAIMLEKGQKPPLAVGDGKRTAQINIRVTEEEKLLLEEAARQEGFRGVSDFVRTHSLSSVR